MGCQWEQPRRRRSHVARPIADTGCPVHSMAGRGRGLPDPLLRLPMKGGRKVWQHTVCDGPYTVLIKRHSNSTRVGCLHYMKHYAKHLHRHPIFKPHNNPTVPWYHHQLIAVETEAQGGEVEVTCLGFHSNRARVKFTYWGQGKACMATFTSPSPTPPL